MPSPAVGAGRVRCGHAAAAVNFPDVLLIGDEYQISLPAPFVPGSEFAGEIVELADDADQFAAGDRVSGTVGLAAVQLGVALGASVTAVASTNEARRRCALRRPPRRQPSPGQPEGRARRHGEQVPLQDGSQ